MYKVVEFFHDLQDGGHAYNPGDTFPRDGVKVSDERIAELAGYANRRGMKLIEKVEKVEKAEKAEKAVPKKRTRK